MVLLDCANAVSEHGCATLVCGGGEVGDSYLGAPFWMICHLVVLITLTSLD